MIAAKWLEDFVAWLVDLYTRARGMPGWKRKFAEWYARWKM